jgi:hypothetical protein
MAGGKPGIDDLYEVDIVQCKADGTEVWGKLLCNGPSLTWKDDTQFREAPSTFCGCLMRSDNPAVSLSEAVPGVNKYNEELLHAAIKMPMAWDKKGQEFMKAITMDPTCGARPPHLQPGGAPKPPDLPAVHSIYCLGRKLEGGFLRRVHAAMVAGGPLILLGEGETYDSTRWAPIAGKEADPPMSCTVS